MKCTRIIVGLSIIISSVGIAHSLHASDYYGDGFAQRYGANSFITNSPFYFKSNKTAAKQRSYMQEVEETTRRYEADNVKKTPKKSNKKRLSRKERKKQRKGCCR